ncbi:hypothetical protein KAR29_08365 [Aminithiophilus ramosus]|uniref:Uncharacterized protein n=2 Tax=Synergistales TaxID=649776 RepID=A0A9Q7AKY9_9BACT|nr:hypothetical protein [Aminithiophilus ramosus]QTX31393.1 hypothetical protein KAR29_08365 [Aminithiophilus ramosus]QVL35192.1 hypothetical protein KIH16_08185 [Synergistota bacterium]
MATEEERPDWKAFRDEVLDRARERGDDGFLRYASSMTDRAWRHVVEEGVFSPSQAEERLRGFYLEDLKFR